jgi:hypothetical protein
MSISQSDSSKEFVESANAIRNPHFLPTNVMVETTVIFNSAGFLSSEQIENKLLIRSSDCLTTKTVGLSQSNYRFGSVSFSMSNSEHSF